MQFEDNSQAMLTVNSVLNDQYKQLEADYRNLKVLMDDCFKPLDKLTKKLLPIKSEVQLLGHSIKGINQMIFEVSGNLTKNLLKNFMSNSKVNFSQAMPSNIKQNLSSVFRSFITGQRETGGNVAAGASYLVGEKGPEVFRPSASGRIVNSQHLAPINVVMNITTNDARSFQKSQSQIVAEAALLLRNATRNL